MRAPCVSLALSALCMGSTMHAFSLSGEAEPLGGPLGGAPLVVELDSFVETDGGDLESLNPPLAEEDGWDRSQSIGAHTWGSRTGAGALVSDGSSVQRQQRYESMHEEKEQRNTNRGEVFEKRRVTSSPPAVLQPDAMMRASRNIRRASPEASALQITGGGSLLAGIGSALLGSAAGTLVGGAQQTLTGPFALNTPQTNLTANLPGVPGAEPVPVGAPPDTSHNVTGIVIGVVVGLLVLCVVGGCVWKMTKKKSKR